MSPSTRGAQLTPKALVSRSHPGPWCPRLPSLRLFQNEIFARLDSRDGSVEFREMLLQRGAMVGPEFENGDAPGGEVLLIAEVLVRYDEHFKPSLFCRV